MNKELKKKIAEQVRSNLEEQGIQKEAISLTPLWKMIKGIPRSVGTGIGNVAREVGVGMGAGQRGTATITHSAPQGGLQGGAESFLSPGFSGTAAFGKALALGAGLGLAGVAIGAGGAAAQAGYKGVKDPLMRRVGFKRMLREDDNQWMHNENKGKLKKLHSTLYRFSPKMALDPLVSGAFMKKQLEFADVGIQQNDLATIANIEKAVRDAGSKEIMHQAFAGGGIAGLGGLL